VLDTVVAIELKFLVDRELAVRRDPRRPVDVVPRDLEPDLSPLGRAPAIGTTVSFIPNRPVRTTAHVGVSLPARAYSAVITPMSAPSLPMTSRPSHSYALVMPVSVGNLSSVPRILSFSLLGVRLRRGYPAARASSCRS
jgi:hypothetical protein